MTAARESGRVRVLAPAKVNLFLHVGGLRPDRLHDLASLMVFVDVGDVIEAAPAKNLSLEVDGPFAPALAPFPIESNLVLRAARALQAACGVKEGASIRLRKNLPVAAGIGGGSTDAAAALNALVDLWDVDISPTALSALAFRLGADVPACLDAAPVRVTGAGEAVSAGPAFAPVWIALVNPRVATPTGPIFRAYDAANPTPPAPSDPAPSRLSCVADIAALMAASRNDLEAPAVARAPVIADVIAFLAGAPGAVAARMSGSGATCFALFSSAEAAKRCATAAQSRGWWGEAGKLL